MAVSVEEFWELLQTSGLQDAARFEELRREFSRLKGAAATTSHGLAAWLADQQATTAYQNTVLLAGYAGPFDYGDYRVLASKTHGALAGTYRAVHRPTQHQVLLRFLAGDFLRDNTLWKGVVERTERWSKVVNRHLAIYFHAQALPRFRFLVLENLQGCTLAECLQCGSLPVDQVAHIGRLAALGLGVLHQAGLRHGRVTPHSIWLCDDGNVKWLPDPTDASDSYGDDPRIVEELADYAAPELPSQGISTATDLYGLGCVLYEALTGRPPFLGGSIEDKQHRHATEAIEPPNQVPAELVRTISFLMAKNPAVRTASAAVAAQQLEPWVSAKWRAFRPTPPEPSQRALERYLRQNPPPTDPPPLPTVLAAPQPISPAASPATPTVSDPPRTPLGANGSAARTTVPAEHVGPRPSPVVAPSTPSLIVPSPFPPTVPDRLAQPATVAAASRPIPAPTLPSSASAAPTVAAGEEPRGLSASAASAADAANEFAPMFAGVTAAKTRPDVAAPPSLLQVADPDREESPLPTRRRVNTPAYLIKQSLLGAAAALLLGGVAYLLALPRADRDEPRRRPLPSQFASRDANRGGERAKKAATAGGDAEPTAADAAGGLPVSYRILDQDDGRSLWAPPTQGPALDLRLAPAQVQAVVAVRPELFESDEGQRLYRALGPRFAELHQQWEAAAGVPWTEISLLLCTLHPAGEQFPRPAFVVSLRQPRPRADLLQLWPDAPAQSTEAGDVLSHQGWSFFVPSGDEVSQFAMGSPDEMADVAERQGAPPPLRSVAQKLMEFSDSQRHLNVLVFPHDLEADLFRDGRSFYFGEAKKVREPLQWLLGDGLQAVLFSMHVDSAGAYLELRMAPELGLDRYDLAEKLRQRLNDLPRTLQSYLAQRINPPVYWREVAFQLPLMLRFVHDQLRVQTEDVYAVVNAYLPTTAAHNLAFAGEMLLSATPDAAMVAAAEPSGDVPRSLDELLARKTTIAFPQLSLEFAMNAVVEDVREAYPNLPFPFVIKMLGNDLEIGSVTRNQQIRDFSQQDQAFSDILTAMVVKANPNPGATGPQDPKQTLVWAIGPNPDDASQTVVLITTREAALTKKYQLSKAFLPDP